MNSDQFKLLLVEYFAAIINVNYFNSPESIAKLGAIENKIINAYESKGR